MNNPCATTKKLKQLAIGASVASFVLLSLLSCIFYMARLPLTDHRNLSYTMWKFGLRDYDWTVTKAGILHDHKFRESLIGMTVEEFNKKFPNTFYEMQTAPPGSKEERTYFTDNYFASRPGGHQYGFVWVVVFEKDRLLQFGSDKGI